VGLEAAQQKLSACIGSTSAKACRAAGLSRVVYPEDPGIPGWVDCVLEGMKQQAAHV
jgi:uroporphyrinogen-III synthase